MNSDQIQNLEPIESVIGVTDDLFGFLPDVAKLIGLCYIPLREIGNFHTQRQVLTTIIRNGEVALPCKTFEINSVMASSELTGQPLGGIGAGQVQYLDNPWPSTEFVNHNTMAPWHNIFDAQGSHLGRVENGVYYDRNRVRVGTAQADSLRQVYVSQGGAFTVPVNYWVEGSCIKFTERHVPGFQGDRHAHAQLPLEQFAHGPYTPALNPPANGLVTSADRHDHLLYSSYSRYDNSEVQIRFETLIEDERGYPLIDEPTKTALAYYMNYTRQLAKYFNQEVRQDVANEAEQLYNRKVAQARSSLVMNENLKRKILNVLYSHNRAGHKPDYHLRP